MLALQTLMIEKFIQKRLDGDERDIVPNTIKLSGARFGEGTYAILSCRKYVIGVRAQVCGWHLDVASVPDGERRLLAFRHSRIHLDAQGSRGLRDIQVKRRTVETLMQPVRSDDGEVTWWHHNGYERARYEVFQLMALRWDDHEDYDISWLPT